MKHAISSLFQAVRAVRFAADEGATASSDHYTTMSVLGQAELRQICGGDEGDLPKGGWKAAASSVSAA